MYKTQVIAETWFEGLPTLLDRTSMIRCNLLRGV